MKLREVIKDLGRATLAVALIVLPVYALVAIGVYLRWIAPY